MRVKFTNFPKEYKILKKKLIQKLDKIGSVGQYVLGDELKIFEKKIEKLLKVKHVLGVGNWTEGTVMVLKGLGYKKGDEIIVIAGKDKGKTGKIVKMLPQKMKAVVSEINKVKKNQKPDNNQPGGIIDKDMPIHLSNLAYYDSELKKGVRIGYKIDKNKKLRFNKSTGKEIK